MAITKLVSPSTPNPTGTGAGASWDLAMAQLTAVKKILSGEQMLLTQWTNTTTMPKLALGIYLQHLGAIYVVDSADYTIPTPSSDGTWYVKLTVSGETLTVSVVNSLSGFAWSSQHNGLYNVSNEQILPYQIVRGGAGTTYEKRKILNLANATNAFTTINYLGKVYGMSVGDTLEVTGNATIGGAISGASLAVTGAISGASLAVTGAISGASLAVTGAITDKNSNNIITPTYLSITIDASSAPASAYIPDMEIGEIKIIEASLITGGPGKRASLLYPATGKYIKTGIINSYDSAGSEWAGHETTVQSTKMFYGFAIRVG